MWPPSAKPSQQWSPRFQRQLSKYTKLLSAIPENNLYITSNRGLDQVKETLPELPSDVGYLLENGRFMKITKTENSPLNKPLADQINGARGSANFNIVRDATSISVEPPVPSQGKEVTVSYALDLFPGTHPPPEFIFAAGGARNDEAMFRWANELAAAPDPTRFRTTEFGQRLDVTTLTAGTHATEAEST
jgi:trehalose-6-phosphatase